MFDGSAGPASFGYQVNALLAEVDALPWWMYLHKRRIRMKAQRLKAGMDEAQAGFVANWSTEFVRRVFLTGGKST